MFALVLIGAPGAGKTSVAEALSDLLVGDEVRHALIETEALTSAHPPLPEEQWLMPVQAVCELYRRFAYPLLLVVATVESAAELNGLLGALGADETAVVALRAAPATLRRRIVEREPEGWSGLDALVAATERIATAVDALDGVALVLSTEDEAPPAVARRIRDAFPRALGAPASRSTPSPRRSAPAAPARSSRSCASTPGSRGVAEDRAPGCTSSPTGPATSRRRQRRSARSSPRAPTSTPPTTARSTASGRCTGRRAATTSRRSTRCWTPAPTSRPAAA